jgi:cell division septation protein DedD
VSVVVLLLAGAGILGFLYGVKKADRSPGQASMDLTEDPQRSVSIPAPSETPAPVTFYTVLTESKEEKPAPAQPREPSEKPVEKEMNESPPEGDLSLLLQVASYKSREAARQQLENLSAEGYSGTIQVADLGERGTWYRVRLGPYGSEGEADRILEKLRKERDLKGYIVR